MESADCECQRGHVSINHFLLDCTRWLVQRRRMLSMVLAVLDDAQQLRPIPLTESLPLGASMLTIKEYKPVLKAVTAFVLATKGASWRYLYARSRFHWPVNVSNCVRVILSGVSGYLKQCVYMYNKRQLSSCGF